MAFTTPHLLYEVRDKVAYLTFNRPEARNALTRDMYLGICRACEAVDNDPDAEVMVIAGSPGAFCAGGDIVEGARFIDSLHADGASTDAVLFGSSPNAYMPADPIRAIQSTRKIVVAVVDGICMGGGFMTAMTADLCVASTNALFAVPEARIGVIDAWVAGRLPMYVGMERAKYFILTGRPLPAATAADWGLISAALPRAELDAYVASLLSDLLAAAPTALQAYKLLANQRLPTDEATTANYAVANAVFRSPSAREGLTAFRDKRKPIW